MSTRSVLALLSTALVALGTPLQAAAAPTTGPSIPLARTAARAFLLAGLSPDGSQALTRDCCTSSTTLTDLATGAATPVPAMRAIDRSGTVGVEVTGSGVIVHDLATKTTRSFQSTFLIGSAPVPAEPLGDAAISPSGRFVAFRASSGAVARADLFLIDLESNQITRVGDRFPAACNGQTGGPVFSADDSTLYVSAGNFANCPDEFAGYRSWRMAPAGGPPTEVAFLPGGVRPLDGGFTAPTQPVAASTNGRYLLFSSFATNLAPGATDGVNKLFLLDTATTTVTFVANRPVDATMSDSGGRVAFVQEMIVPGGGTLKGFVFDAPTDSLSPLDLPPLPADPFAAPSQAWITPDGNRVVVNVRTSDPGLPGADGTVFRGNLGGRRGDDESISRVPDRILDTREAIGVPTTTPLAGGGTIELQVSGAHGVPANAGGAVLNVTVDQPAGPGFVTIWPCGQPRPTASNLNYVAGQTIPNLVVTALGAQGKVCLFSSQRAHLVADLSAVLPAGSLVTTAAPQRILDTRVPTGVPTASPVAARATLALDFAGSHGVPADAKAVILNVTVDRPVAAGYLTVHPCLATPPTASNLNYAAGQTIPNAVLAPLSADGQICLTTQQRTDVIVDLAGYIDATAAYVPTGPSRLLDTREARGVPTRTPLLARQVLELAVANGVDAPSDASTAVLNVTVDQPAGTGFVTVWPCGQPMPLASNLNFVRNQTIPNLVLAQIGADGKVCFFATQSTHMIVDLDGYLPAA